MSYQVVELLQLIFALLAIFGAFLGGVAVGWWRWGRPEAKRSEAGDRSAAMPTAGLFSAHERHHDIGETDIREPMGHVEQITQAGAVPTFGTAKREIGVGSDGA